MEMAIGGYMDVNITDTVNQYALMKLTGEIVNGRPEFTPTDDLTDVVEGVLIYNWYGADESVRDGHDLEIEMDGTRTPDRLISIQSPQNPESTCILDSTSDDVVAGDYLMPSDADDGLAEKFVADGTALKFGRVLVGGTNGDTIVYVPLKETAPEAAP